MRDALTGLKAYQGAPRPPRHQAGRISAAVGRASLRCFGDSGRPVIFVPSLINGSEVLDLSADNSMMAWLAAQGLRPHLLDWGCPDPAERDLTVIGHVERYLLPLLETAGPDAVLAGYCLGGTMAIAASAVRPPAGLILIATPWDFAGFPSQAREGLRHLWDAAAQPADALGLLPAETLQQAFWQLDPVRTIRKFEEFAAKDPASPEGQKYVAVEDWANGGAPLTFAAGRELLEGLFVGNASGEGRWRIDGRKIDPATFRMPVLNIVSTIDRITPAATAWTGGDHRALDQGHVGMVVGSRARTSLWPTLSDWLSRRRDS